MSRAEEQAVEADERAQERAGARSPKPPRIARDYVRAKHPDTGLQVVFLPGELLPAWVRLPVSPM